MVLVDFRLFTFITVVEKKSFSLAARELNLTQPAVTAQVHNLERYYGVRLLNRYSRTIELTPAGEILYRYGKKILELYEQTQAEIRGVGGVLRGRLAIGATLTVGEYVLPYIIGLFKSQFEEVEVSMYLGNKEEICRLLLEGKCDAVIIAGDYHNKSIISESFLNDKLTIVVSPQHPWAGQEILTLEEFCRGRFICREKGASTRRVIEEALKEVGVNQGSLNVIMEISSQEAIKRLVEANFGVAILSEWVVKKELQLGTLVRVRVEGLNIMRNVNFVYPRYHIGPLVREFLKFCKRNREIVLRLMDGTGWSEEGHIERYRA